MIFLFKIFFIISIILLLLLIVRFFLFTKIKKFTIATIYLGKQNFINYFKFKIFKNTKFFICNNPVYVHSIIKLWIISVILWIGYLFIYLLNFYYASFIGTIIWVLLIFLYLHVLSKNKYYFKNKDFFFQAHMLLLYFFNSIFFLVSSPYFTIKIFYIWFILYILYFIFWFFEKKNLDILHFFFFIIISINVYLNFFDLFFVFFILYSIWTIFFSFYSSKKNMRDLNQKRPENSGFLFNHLYDFQAVQYHFKYDFPYVEKLRKVYSVSLMLLIAIRGQIFYDVACFDLLVSIFNTYVVLSLVICYTQCFIIKYSNPIVRDKLVQYCLACVPIVTGAYGYKYMLDSSLTNPDVLTYPLPGRQLYEKVTRGFAINGEVDKYLIQNYQRLCPLDHVPVKPNGYVDREALLKSLHQLDPSKFPLGPNQRPLHLRPSTGEQLWNGVKRVFSKN